MFNFLKPNKDVVDDRSRNDFVELLKVLIIASGSVFLTLVYMGKYSGSVIFGMFTIVYLFILVFQKDKRINELENILIIQRKQRDKEREEARKESETANVKSSRKPVRRRTK